MDDFFFTSTQAATPPPAQTAPSQTRGSILIDDFIGSGADQITPGLCWHQGKTYTVGVKSNSNLNAVVMTVFDPNTGVTDSYDVAPGTSKFDEYNHPRPGIYFANGALYVFRINTHIDPLEIWKANDINDLSLGFTLIQTINCQGAYPQLFMANGAPHFFIRNHGVAPFSHYVLAPTGTIEDPYNLVELTRSDYAGTAVRHYNKKAKEYGTTTKHWFVVNLRPDNIVEINKFYANAVYYCNAGDFTTVHSWDNNFTKNIATNGGVTHAEIEANLVINGRFENGSWDQYYKSRYMDALSHDDVFYGITNTDGENEQSIIKIVPGVNPVKTSAVIPVENIHSFNDTNNGSIWYNGANIFVAIQTKYGFKRYNEIWSCDMNLQNFKFHSRYEHIRRLFFPQNMDQITGEYQFAIGGGEGIYWYVNTEDKFLN